MKFGVYVIESIFKEKNRYLDWDLTSYIDVCANILTRILLLADLPFLLTGELNAYLSLLCIEIQLKLHKLEVLH